MYLCTDNAVFKSTYFRGSSKSQTLHELILGLRLLELYAGVIIYAMWISGRRMILHGTDGLSRGDLNAGVMRGECFLKHLPFNESALERSPSLKKALLLWTLQ